jgi:tellurite resistance protein TehA-like permease
LSNPELVAEAVRIAAIAGAIFLWGLAFWFFAAALLATARMPDRSFHLSWWSFVFPNVGFTIACIRIGEVLGNEGVLWMATVLTVVLVVVWALLAVFCVRAVIKKQIVWPGRDEDSD